MSLKVLLADDSAAIKKVVQLSLQDFGAEVKSVGSGKDVLDVCRSFHPDIAFVDVLLPHKTGYEVVSELKKDVALKATPVVMLWSAFMAFDEGKFKASGADEKLEKPFEVSGLRSLVTKLVPKVSGSPIARHLEFPKVQFEQPIGSVPPPKKAAEPIAPIVEKPAAGQPAEEEWSMASFEEIGTFTGKMDKLKEETKGESIQPIKPLPVEEPATATPVLPEPAAKNADAGTWGGDSEWVRKDITSKFQVPIPPEEQEENTVTFQYTENEISDTSFLFKPQPGQTAPPSGTQTAVTQTGSAQAAQGAPAPSPAPQTTPEKMADVLKPLAPEPEILTPVPAAAQAAQSRSVLSEEDMAKIREEVREAVEKAVWKLVPELASQLIKEELQRLLGEES